MKKIILLISLFLTTQIIKAQCWNTIYYGGTSGYNFFKIKTDGTLWTSLTSFLGGEGIAGGKMKSTGTTQWFTTNKMLLIQVDFQLYQLVIALIMVVLNE